MSQPTYEPAVIGFYRIIGVLLNVLPRRRDQLMQHAGVDRAGMGDHFGAA
jgi:hypothetical protein